MIAKARPRVLDDAHFGGPRPGAGKAAGIGAARRSHPSFADANGTSTRGKEGAADRSRLLKASIAFSVGLPPQRLTHAPGEAGRLHSICLGFPCGIEDAFAHARASPALRPDSGVLCCVRVCPGAVSKFGLAFRSRAVVSGNWGWISAALGDRQAIFSSS